MASETSPPGGATRYIQTTRGLLSSSDRVAIEKLLDRRLAARGQDCQPWESEINDRVYRLYGLTREEIRIVEESAKK